MDTRHRPTRGLIVALAWASVGALTLLPLHGCGGGDDKSSTKPPAITTHPASVAVDAPSAATFTVTAEGRSLNYQWQRSLDGGATWSDLAGETSASLTVQPTAVDPGPLQFRVIVSNTAGSVTSNAATLTVAPDPNRPIITTQPAAQTVTEPDPATFSVTATGPALTYQWQRSADNGGQWAPVAGANAATYTTTATAASMSGEQYRVVITNASGTATSNTAVLTVNAAPPPPPVASDVGLLIEEVVYLPAAGQHPFIDLVNHSDEPLPLKPLTLLVDDVAVPLERVGMLLAARAHLLVVVDGELRADGTTYHTGDNVAVSAAAGHAKVIDRFGHVLDEVAWGETAGAVSPTPGGVTLEVTPGTSIGRAPGANRRRTNEDWVGYLPAEATPGGSNPPPTVRGLHPADAATVQRSSAELSWFPVPAASRYHVQVASDGTFASLVVDQYVAAPRLSVSGLATGRYEWRVAAEYPGGAKGAFSPTGVVTLADEAVGASSKTTRLAAEAVTFSRILGVPLLVQRKDTAMLLLERPVPSGAHTWDSDHGTLDPDDPADNMNCVLASLAMMNNYRNLGDLNQDRIGFEVFKGYTAGPERDLMYGHGLFASQVTTAYVFAMGTTPARLKVASVGLPDFLLAVGAEIDADRPVLVANTHHAFVITGYKILDGSDIVLVANDPWHGRKEYDFGDGLVQAAALVDWQYWISPGAFAPRRQEPSVKADSDGDGVVDFDETERFHTDPNDPDTDQDGVGDKKDVYSGVFDSVRGYAYFRTGRDDDADGKATELDPDSDAGGCKDGVEDVNGNGIFDGSESWNFRFVDDLCGALTGHLQYRSFGETWSIPDVFWHSWDNTSQINVALKPDPNTAGYYVDDGSSWQFSGASESELILEPGCSLLAKSWAGGSGDFLGLSAAPATAQITDDGRLAVHFVAGLAAEQTSGWGGGCGLESGVGVAGNSYSAMFEDDCWGDAVAEVSGGRRTFRFACTGTDWQASGEITVEVP